MRVAKIKQERVSRKARRQKRPMAGRRSHERAPILTQVEAQGAVSPALGRARDISVGGLLIETRDTLSEGATVVVRFFVPPSRSPLETAGRVVRCEQGKSMAIAFLGLPENHRQKILEYIQSIRSTPSESWLEPKAGPVGQRRSARLPRRVAVVLSWQDEDGHVRQEAAETQRLSRYGAMLLSFSEFAPGSLVRMSVPDTGKEGLSRIVWTAAAEVPGRVKMGVEVMGKENVWGLEFPQDEPEIAEAPRIARRRSGRLPRRLDVVLNWVDEYGRVREEQGQTSMVSKHGAAVSVVAGLAVKQRFRLRVPVLGKEADSHVVWARPGMVPGRTDMGVEFLEIEDFWNLRFPPDPGSTLSR